MTDTLYRQTKSPNSPESLEPDHQRSWSDSAEMSVTVVAWRRWHAAFQALQSAWIEADTTPSPAADAVVAEADRAEEAARAAVLARRELTPAAIGARLHIVFTLAEVVDDPANEPLRDLARLTEPLVPADLARALRESIDPIEEE